MRKAPWVWAVSVVVSSLSFGCGDDGSSGGASGGASGGGGSDAGSTGGNAGQAGAGATGGSGVGGSSGSGASGGSAGSGATGSGGASGGSGGTGGVSANCMEELDKRGVPYKTTTAKGVVDAVNLTGKLNGVLIAKTDTDQVATDPMACKFVLHLWDMAEVLKQHGIHKIGTLGSYCYRCCCYWSEQNFCRGPNDPEPDCSQPPWSGYSNHSWGRAIDIRWLYTDSGQVYDVNNPSHFVEWANSSETCGKALAAQTGISKELYSLACDFSNNHVFGTVLTPNYNSAHRNHFHADIGQSAEPSKWVVLSQPMGVDVGPGDD